MALVLFANTVFGYVWVVCSIVLLIFVGSTRVILRHVWRTVGLVANTPIKIQAVTGSREIIPVELVGVKYQLRPPKAAFGLKLAAADQNDQGAMARLVTEWIQAAFGDQAEAVMARLDDYDDDLDLMHLMELMQLVMERVTGNPTT